LATFMILISLLGIAMASPIHDAAERGDLKTVKKLIDEFRTTPNEKDKDGWAPLHYASKYGHVKVIEYLIKEGASIDVKDDMGYTPLVVAVAMGESDTAKYLIDKGADINVKVCVDKIVKNQLKPDNTSETTVVKEIYNTPLDFAVNGNYIKITEYLKSKGAKSAKEDSEKKVAKVEITDVNSLRVAGMLSMGDKPKVILEDANTKKTFMVSEGDYVGNFKVEKIGKNTVRLNDNGKKIDLAINLPAK
jgi:ankyrin repeat protein